MGEFSSGDPGANGGGHGAQGFGHNAATSAEFIELIGCSNGHGLWSLVGARLTALVNKNKNSESLNGSRSHHCNNRHLHWGTRQREWKNWRQLSRRRKVEWWPFCRNTWDRRFPAAC